MSKAEEKTRKGNVVVCFIGFYFITRTPTLFSLERERFAEPSCVAVV
jgi:hypothetical protein